MSLQRTQRQGREMADNYFRLGSLYKNGALFLCKVLHSIKRTISAGSRGGAEPLSILHHIRYNLFRKTVFSS